MCVEMEGAAVAQVCYEYGVPFVVVRTISDAANDDAAINFTEFVAEHAGPFGKEFVHLMIKNIAEK